MDNTEKLLSAFIMASGYDITPIIGDVVSASYMGHPITHKSTTGYKVVKAEPKTETQNKSIYEYLNECFDDEKPNPHKKGQLKDRLLKVLAKAGKQPKKGTIKEISELIDWAFK